MIVVIPTYNRAELLQRALSSIAEADKPAQLQQIIIAENGQIPAAQNLVEAFRARLPLRYQFNSKPNKSYALNQVLAGITSEFIVFLDDDVRIAPGTLNAYAAAMVRSPRNSFFGGRCLIDYEMAPPDWLRAYLPPSAKGWDLGDDSLPLSKPDALGFNWGAFATDLKDAGGFNENRGPGTPARGQETEMQQKLLTRGVCGFYLPDAVAWHWVPTSRCSPDWCLDRARQMGVRDGIDFALTNGSSKRFRSVIASRLKAVALQNLDRVKGPGRDERHFSYQYRCFRHKGFLEGLRLAKSERDPARGR